MYLNLILLGIMVLGLLTAAIAGVTFSTTRERRARQLRVQTIGNGVAQASGALYLLTFFVPLLLSNGWMMVFPVLLLPVFFVLVIRVTIESIRKSDEQLTDRDRFVFNAASSNGFAYVIVSVLLVSYLAPLAMGWFAKTSLGDSAAWLEFVLPWIPVAIVIGFLPAVIALRRKTIARLQQVAQGHPVSDEVAAHAIGQARDRITQMLRGGFGYFRGVYLIFAVFGAFALFVAVALWGTKFGAPEGDASVLAVPAWITIVAIAGTYLTMIFGLVLAGRGFLAQLEGDYIFAGLTPAQREEAYLGLFRPEIHRFQDKIANPDRRIRVLSIRRDGTVALEDVASRILINGHSAPVEEVGEALDEEDLDEAETEADLAPLTPEEERYDELLDRITERLSRGPKHPGVESFDLFWDSSDGGVHVVAIGTTDYQQFPEELAQEIQNTL